MSRTRPIRSAIARRRARSLPACSPRAPVSALPRSRSGQRTATAPRSRASPCGGCRQRIMELAVGRRRGDPFPVAGGRDSHGDDRRVAAIRLFPSIQPAAAMNAADRAIAARILAALDLTSLGEDDTPEAIERLCAAAAAGGHPAAVCVYPEHIATARRTLELEHASEVAVATVVNFPDGGNDISRVLRETRRALAAGADEIDIVFPWRAYLGGDREGGALMLQECKAICGRKILKVILETGELGDPLLIREISFAALGAGADFIKTSTGKAKIGATPAAARTMLECIREQRRQGRLQGRRRRADLDRRGPLPCACRRDPRRRLGDACAIPHRREHRCSRNCARHLHDRHAGDLAAAGSDPAQARRRGARRRGPAGAGARHGRRQPGGRAGRRIRDGGLFPRHDIRGSAGAHARNARQRGGLRLAQRIPAGAGTRQAFDRRHRRSRVAGARPDARCLWRLGADDRRPWARAHRRHARQAGSDTRLSVRIRSPNCCAHAARSRCCDHRCRASESRQRTGASTRSATSQRRSTAFR